MSGHRHQNLFGVLPVLIGVCLCTLLGAVLDEAAFAQKVPTVEWHKRQNAEERLTSFGEDMFGDAIDPHTGGITFVQTDVSLPGNSHLDVSVMRRRSQGVLPAGWSTTFTSVEFADWELLVPRIKLTTAWNRPWTGNRCSSAYGTILTGVVVNGKSINREEYSNGATVEVGNSKEQLLETPIGAQWQTGATHVTKGNWYFTCGSASDGGQGFIGHAPNGDTYRFDRVIVLNAEPLDSTGNYDLDRKIYVIAATEVTDVNGNWVRYTYDANGRLTQIEANDGRLITFSFWPGGVIQSVTANGRTWNYTYSGLSYDYPMWKSFNGDPAPGDALRTVTLPDGREWNFTLDAMAASTAPSFACFQTGTLSITHPSGATGQFNLEMLGHRYWFDNQLNMPSNGVHQLCPYDAYNPGDTNPFPVWPTVASATTQVMSVVQKQISGPSIPTATWTFEYEQDHTSGTSSTDRTNWTKVTGPGIHITYYHTWNSEPEGGRLLKKEIRNTAGGPLLDLQEFQYVSEGVIGQLANQGLAPPVGDARNNVLTTQAKTTRGTDWWRTINTYDTSFSSPTYSFGAPLTVAIDSNVSTTARTTATTYIQKKPIWVLNLPEIVTINSEQINKFYYDALGRKTAEDLFGVRVADYTYHTTAGYAGMLSSFKDGVNRTTYALNWKRGVPQQITQADSTNVYQTVDNNGWLTSNTDAKGFVTSYGRDSMGRLTSYTPTGMTATTVGYTFNASGAVQTITKGTAQTTLTYDNMWRPTLVKTQETGTGWTSYVNTTYDPLGKMLFASYPSTVSNSTSGVSTSYDALGRTLTTTAPGATTTFQYLANHVRRVIDPLGNQTDSYFTGYDGPDSKEVIRTLQPLGVNTWINRNILGDILSVQQTDGVTSFTQNHYYDSQHRRCRYVTPEGGETLFAYNNANEMTAYQKGASTGTTCVALSGSAKVDLTYDPMGRPLTTNYMDAGTPDITRVYDNNGNLTSLTRGTTAWTYQYNVLNLLTQEKLVIDARTYQTDYGFNPAGILTQTTYPGGPIVEYDPDGLGRARKAQVSGGGTSYASSLAYLPNGTVGSFIYGNGFSFAQTLNARQMPYQISSVLGATKAIDLTLGYNANDQITAITDNADPAINPSWYSQLYTYDGVGNLRQQQLGARLIETQYNATTNRLSQAHDSAVGPSWKSYSYDGRGNVTADGGLGFTYDYSDQPTALSGSAVAAYVYDGNFKRVKQISGGATVYSIYSSAGKLLVRDNATSGVKSIYVDVAGKSLAEINASGAVQKYYHTDHLGSPIAATNAAGAILWREQYSPYGQSMQADASHADNIGFTGHVEDATGLTYMQARYYDPIVGRFLAVDPVEFSPDRLSLFNRYAYGANDPFNRTDPTGECPVCGFIGGMIGGATSALGAVVTDGLTCGCFRGESVAGAAVGGFVSGAIIGATGQMGLGNLAGAAAQSLTEQLLSGDHSVDFGKLGIDTGLGGLMGKIPGTKWQGVTKGRNSWEAIYKSGLTKLKNGTAENMGAKTMMKGAGAAMIGGLNQTAAGMAADMVQGAIDNALGKDKDKKAPEPKKPGKNEVGM